MSQLAPVLLLMSLVVTTVNSSGCTIGQELDPTEGRLRWIFSTPDPCSCSNIHIGGVNPRPVTRPYTPVFTDELLRSRDALRSHFKCPNDMNACVLEDGTSPCLNGGTCHVAANIGPQFTCTCTFDYTGNTCQDPVWTLKEKITHSDIHINTSLNRLYNWIDSDDTRKVRVSLLRGGSSVVELVFNVTGIVDGKWFISKYLIESPQWPSLTSPASEKSLVWFQYAVTVYEKLVYQSLCEDQNGWMAVIDNPRWKNECAWMHGWDAPIVMLYSLNKTPFKWTNVVTEISVSPSPDMADIADGDCQTCYESGWQEDAWIVLELDKPAKVGMVKLKICLKYLTVTCPPIFDTYNTDADQCYHLSNTTMNKTSASQYCKDLSGDRIAEWKVVEIDNREENQDIISTFGNFLDADDNGIWLGYTPSNDDWLADSDGTNQTYFNWPTGVEPEDQACLFMDLKHSIPLDGYWRATECSSDRRVVCEYTGDFGETFSSAHVLLGQNDNISEAAECGVPPSDDSLVYFYTCAEPRATASHVFVRKSTEYKDQLIICELNVYTVNDTLVGVADTMTFETST